MLVGVLPARSFDRSAVPSLPAPGRGVLFGAYVQVSPHTGPTRDLAWSRFESMIGRRMALDRQYYKWTQRFPTAEDVRSEALGRALVLSWSTRRPDGSRVSWRAIAGGRYDRAIDQRARGLAELSGPVYFSFDPEPGRPPFRGPMQGTPQDFVRAYRHLHDRLLRDGVRNLVFVLTLAASVYTQGLASQWWPGAEYVDVLAADGYNWYGCGVHKSPWFSFQRVFRAFYEYGAATHLPLMILEWGTGEDPARPGRKGRWIEDAGRTLRSWPNIVGVSYFDSGRNFLCPRWVDSSPSSLRAFTRMALSPYFNPSPTRRP